MTVSITLKCRTFRLECACLSRQVVCHGSDLSRQVSLYTGKHATQGHNTKISYEKIGYWTPDS